MAIEFFGRYIFCGMVCAMVIETLKLCYYENINKNQMRNKL